jgi:hypothetical protein
VRNMRAAVVAIVTLAILGVSAGTAAADGGKGKHGKGTLKIVAELNQEEFLDLGAPGPSLGDQLVFSEILYKRGREAGTSGVVCVVTETMPPYTVVAFHCVGTLSLRGGQITLQGLIEVQGEDDPGPFTVAITGGTGAYRGASGEAVVRDVSDDITIYKLRFDSKHKKKHRRH